MADLKEKLLVVSLMGGILALFFLFAHKTDTIKESINNMSECEGYKKAVFAGGCFWCMERPFEETEGVLNVLAGYTGGDESDPSYIQVGSGATGHLEAIEVTYDPAKVSYKSLLDIFWRQIDPTDGDGQFVDRGRQYRTAIFYSDEIERIRAEESKERLNSSGFYDKPVITEILPLKKFYRAESYHQDYYKKNPFPYKFYRQNSGRDKFLNKIWE